MSNASDSTLPPFPPAYRASGLLLHSVDIIGLGVVYGHFSNDLQDAQLQAQQLDPNVGVQSHETVLELTYRLALLKSALYFQRICSTSSGRAVPAGFLTRSCSALKSPSISEP